MKKLAIAGASLALAAMPVLGAMADSVVDTVQVTINSACTLEDTSGGTGTTSARTYSTTLQNGGTKTWAAGQTGENGGGVITVSCNNASGWHMTAVGSSELVNGNDSVTKMAPDASGKNPIATSATDTADSYWAFQVTGSSSESAYNSFTAIPSTATKVAGTSGAVSGEVVNVGYKVHVSTTQQAGTYTGKVTYTVNTGANPSNG